MGVASARPSDERASERERALAFLRSLDIAIAGEVTPFVAPGGARGVAIVDRDSPLVWDSNYVLVDAVGESDGEQLIALADELLDGLEHRLIVFADESDGERLRASVARRRWYGVPHTLMVHRDRARLVRSEFVREVGLDALAGVLRSGISSAPWGSESVADQIHRRDRLIDRELGIRGFAAFAADQPVSYCLLYQRDGVAQVESVTTLPAHRNRGLARAVVSRATAPGLRDAHTVFLVADANDWPQALYRRLGYDHAGLLHRFCPRLPGERSPRRQ